MSVLSSIFVGDGGRGAPRAIAITVVAGATGVVATLSRLLDLSSFTRVSGAPTISLAGEISLTTGLAAGESATLVVREAIGLVAWEYPVVLTAQVPVRHGSLAIADAQAREDAGAIVFTVLRSNGTDGAVSARWTIAFGTAGTNDIAGATTGTFTIADGQSSASISIALVNDILVEGDEAFTITLSDVTGGATITAAVAIGTIIDDDRPPASLPAAQTVAFGTKTRAGHGGHALDYVGAGPLSITAGNGAGHWRIDSRNHLVPAGSYGAAPATYAASYTLTVSDGTVTGSVAVNMVAGAAHVRGIQSGDNADFTANARQHQLASVIGVATGAAGALVLGDTVYLRAGSVLNPGGANCTMRSPAGLYAAGTGPLITVRGERPDLSVDAAGNPNRRHAAVCGGLTFETSLAGDVFYPIEFRDIWFYVDRPTSMAGYPILNYSSAAGRGLAAVNCRFEVGPQAPDPWLCDAFRANTAGRVEYCTFANVGKGVISGNATIIRWCEAFDIWEDFIDIGGQNNVVEDNFARHFNMNATTYALDFHCDGTQHFGNKTNTHWNLGRIVRNIFVRDGGSVGHTGFQALLVDDSTGTSTNYIDVANNIFVTAGTSHGMFFNRTLNPRVVRNTVLTDFEADAGAFSGRTATINVPADKAGSGGDFTGNIVNGFAMPGQPGADTANTTTLAKTRAAYEAAMANPVFTGLASREIVKQRFRPKAGGTALQADGSYAGALKPDGTWNDEPVVISFAGMPDIVTGEAYDFTLTKTGAGPWPPFSAEAQAALAARNIQHDGAGRLTSTGVTA